MSGARTGARIGIDVGGTFTDVALEVGGRRFTSKVLTTTDDPAVACMRALEEGLVRSQTGPCDIDVIIHGTTLATNAILERKGATTSLVTTEGFRDTIEMGTEGRPEQYEINIVKPRPLVPRRRRFTVAERLNSRGEVLVPLDEDKLEALLPSLDAAGTESLTIGFLHSYANPAHEHLARDYFTKCRPAWSITISSDVSPEFREFERFSTACANAYVRPLIERYLDRFDAALRERGFRCPLLLMLSSGGLTTVETAKRFPVRLMESGPGRRSHLRRRNRQGPSPGQGDVLRHGRHHGENLSRRRWLGPDEPPIRGRPGLSLPQGQRDSPAHPGHRHGGDRRGRRLHRLDRRIGPDLGRTRERRCAARSGVLCLRRTRADRHRRQRGHGPNLPAPLRRRQGGSGSSQGRGRTPGRNRRRHGALSPTPPPSA